jgi:hypothetical protein
MSLSYRFPTTTTTQSSPEEAAFNEGCSSSNSDLAAQAGLAVDATVASSWFDEMVGGASESDFFTNAAGALEAATPAAIAITGTPDWYYARHDDAEARLAGEGLTPPSYYLDYGGKYCTAFTKDLRPKLSPEGQAWCDATALALQDAIESHRAADPLGYVTLEKDDAAFTKFAFETHPDAYLNSGLDELGPGDLLLIGTTPEVADLVGPGGLVQVVDTGLRIIPLWAEELGIIDPEDAAAIDRLLVDAHPTIEWAVTQGYELAAIVAWPLVEVVDGLFGDGTLVRLLDEARQLVQDGVAGTSDPAGRLLELEGMTV